MFSQTIQPNANWKVNEKQTYHTNYSKVIVAGTDSSLSEGYDYDIELTIQKKDKNGYTISCIYKNVSCPEILKNSSYEANHKVYENLSFQYKTDINGSFLGLVNKESLKKEVLKRYDAYMKSDSLMILGNSLSDNLISKKVEESFENGVFELSTLKELRYIHDCLGISYNTKKVTEKDKTISDPIIESVLPAHSVISAKLNGKNIILDEKELVDKNELTNKWISFTLEATIGMMKFFHQELTEDQLNEARVGLREKFEKDYKNTISSLIHSEINKDNGWLIQAQEKMTHLSKENNPQRLFFIYKIRKL